MVVVIGMPDTTALERIWICTLCVQSPCLSNENNYGEVYSCRVGLSYKCLKIELCRVKSPDETKNTPHFFFKARILEKNIRKYYLYSLKIKYETYMEKDFFNTILQNINVVDENGLGYDISLLPEAKKEYENYKNRCLANEWNDSHFDEWSDADTLKFIRKSSLVEFIDDPAKRKQAILENKANVYFPVCDNKSASNEMPWNEIHQLNGVEKYNSLIVAAAKEYSLDPDLLRAIVYMETTHGYYDNAISHVFRAFNLTPNYIPEGVNKSILPMNINTQFWGDNFGSREGLRNCIKKNPG